LEDPASDVHRSVDTESGVPPIDQAGGDLGTDKLLVQEELDDHPAKVLRDPFEVPEGDMHEPAGIIEAAFQHEAVEMGIPS
jgi:hypothetical protein